MHTVHILLVSFFLFFLSLFYIISTHMNLIDSPGRLDYKPVITNFSKSDHLLILHNFWISGEGQMSRVTTKPT
jgi:hypothetical protein